MRANLSNMGSLTFMPLQMCVCFGGSCVEFGSCPAIECPAGLSLRAIVPMGNRLSMFSYTNTRIND